MNEYKYSNMYTILLRKLSINEFIYFLIFVIDFSYFMWRNMEQIPIQDKQKNHIKSRFLGLQIKCIATG